ncbi:MAG: NAD(P)/FAD-dependent oxidoreductase [Deltaproteobacteria bacterium]|nr:NAD(P)/FAD-dependent oxidoreductase [Deltaproteobacteria bacterium]
MLKDGEKGAIIQKGKETYAIAPHVKCGVVTPDDLRKLADVAEKYDATALKITSAARIAIVGLKEEDIDNVWNELDMPAGHAVGLCVRSIKTCPGTTFCKLGKQDSLSMGMKLDGIYHGMNVPSKMKMAVSGCKIQCGENCIKDLSMYGTKDGWTVLVGGMGGTAPRLADVLIEGLSTEEAEEMIQKVTTYYKENSKKERIGKMVDRMGGIEALKEAVLN